MLENTNGQNGVKEKVYKYILKNNMISKGDAVVAGVSGGSDSMCLLKVLMELKNLLRIHIVVVHIHHGLRGKTADEDMKFVENYCKNNPYGEEIEFFGYKFDIATIAKNDGTSHEEAGRLARYSAFNEVAKKLGERGYENVKIAVAHNLEDTAETILFNMFRGSGIKGITGICPIRDNIIRPILCLDKKEIYDYLKECDLTYRVDETNFTDEYSRNKIRLNVLPYVKENINIKASEHIVSMASYVGEAYDLVIELSSEAYAKYVTMNSKIQIDVQIVNEKHIITNTVIRMAIEKLTNSLKDITNKHIEDVYSLFFKQTGAAINLPYGLVAKKDYKAVVLYRDLEKKVRVNEKNSSIKDNVINVDLSELSNGEGLTVHVEEICDGDEKSAPKSTFSFYQNAIDEVCFDENKYTKWFDYGIVKGIVSIRNRRQGDYIIVDNKGSRKKLKDFFIDMKIPREERDNVILLANGSEIMWVVGYRMGANYKVEKDSKNIVKVEVR